MEIFEALLDSKTSKQYQGYNRSDQITWKSFGHKNNSIKNNPWKLQDHDIAENQTTGVECCV